MIHDYTKNIIIGWWVIFKSFILNEITARTLGSCWKRKEGHWLMQEMLHNAWETGSSLFERANFGASSDCTSVFGWITDEIRCVSLKDGKSEIGMTSRLTFMNRVPFASRKTDMDAFWKTARSFRIRATKEETWNPSPFQNTFLIADLIVWKILLRF